MSKSMLILEDDVVSRDLLRLVFEYDGYQCFEADNGIAGLDLMESQSFNFIILDNAMPLMTGMEFLAHLKKQPEKTDVPIIMITGTLNSQVRAQATKLGAYAIVGKPYDLGELRALVSQLSTNIPVTQEPTLVPK